MYDLFKITKSCVNCVFHSNNMTVDVEKPCCVYKLHTTIHPENKAEPITLDKFDFTLCDNYILNIDFIPKMYYLNKPEDLRNLYNKMAIFFELSIYKYDSTDYFYPALAMINVNALDVKKHEHINNYIKILPMMDILNYEFKAP